MRIRALLVLVVLAAVVGGGVGLRSSHQHALLTVTPVGAHSGAWFCPHGGGHGWHVELSVTNPGSEPIPVRITTLAKTESAAPRRIVVPKASSVRIPVKADTRGAGTELEYFGGWVGVSWIARAGGRESGIDAEPCSPTLGRTWYLPDNTTIRGEDAWAVVMNPTATPAIFSVHLDTEEQSILTRDWAEFVLKPERSVAFHVNQKALGRQTVAVEVLVDAGRVAAASLGATHQGGIRASLGIPSLEEGVVLPGGPDTGRSELVVDDGGRRGAALQGTLVSRAGSQALGQLRGERLRPGLAKTFDVSDQPDAALSLSATNGDGIAVARRSFGPGGDEGSTAGAAPTGAWVVSSGATGSRDTWRLVLSNPGRVTATVKLWLFSAAGLSSKLSPRLVRVPPGRTRAVAADFTTAARVGSILAVATTGTFVPLAASSTSDGTGYSTSVGVPVPTRWLDRAYR
jgi:Family of unknown function (DUF5719)